MKVAFINSVAGVGSTGRIVYQLSRMEGVQGKLYYGRKDNRTDADVYRITDNRGIARHAVMTFLLDDHGFENTGESIAMVENLKEFAPDLVHLHNLHGYYMNVEPLFHWLKESGTPVVWTLHDCWAFTGHCAHFDSLGCGKWRNGCEGKCPALLNYPWTFNPFRISYNFNRKKELFTSLSEDQMTIVTPSFWLRDLVKESFLGKYEVETVHTGLNLERFRPAESDFRSKYGLENRFVILAVAGSWSKQKGLNDLAALGEHLKDGQTLVVVGVNAAQKKLFKGKHVICISHTESIEELCGLYSAADIFLNLTYQDTFPTVNLEAQACGLPVLTYQTGGSPESLSEKTGLVVEKGNLALIEQALEQLQNGTIVLDRSLCRRNAFGFAEDNMLAGYRGLYRRRTGELL